MSKHWTDAIPRVKVIVGNGGKNLIVTPGHEVADAIEDQEMYANKTELVKRYKESLDSGISLTI